MKKTIKDILISLALIISFNANSHTKPNKLTSEISRIFGISSATVPCTFTSCRQFYNSDYQQIYAAYLASAGMTFTDVPCTFSSCRQFYNSDLGQIYAAIISNTGTPTGSGIPYSGATQSFTMGVWNGYANNFLSKTTQVTSAASINSLTVLSSRVQELIGVLTHSFNLPDATTLSTGFTIDFNNNSSGNLFIRNFSGSSQKTVLPGGYCVAICTSTASSAGIWDFHFLMPANSQYGTSGLLVTGSVSATGVGLISGGVTTPTIYGSSAAGGTLNLNCTSSATAGIINMGANPSCTVNIGNSTGITRIKNSTSIGNSTVAPSRDLDVHNTTGIASLQAYSEDATLFAGLYAQGNNTSYYAGLNHCGSTFSIANQWYRPNSAILDLSSPTSAIINGATGGSISIGVGNYSVTSEKINVNTGGVAITGTASISSSLAIGTLTFTDTGVLAAFQSSTNSYNQIMVQNSSNGNQASANVIVTNDVGTATTNYGEFGMNSSTFTGTPMFNQPNDVYVTATTGNLDLGTTTAHAVNIGANNTSTPAITVASNNSVVINYSTTIGTGTVTANTTSLGIVRIKQGTSFLDFGQNQGAFPSIWLQQSSPTTANYALAADVNSTYLNGPTSLIFNTGGSQRAFLSASIFSTTIPFNATSTATIGGAMVAVSTLSVGTNFQASGTMSITGASTLTGAIRASSNLSVTGTCSVGSTATITGQTSLTTYSASGTGTNNALIANTTLSVGTTATVSGAMVAVSTLSVGTNFQASGTMSITGASTLTGAIRASSNLSVTGTFSAGTTATVTGDASLSHIVGNRAIASSTLGTGSGTVNSTSTLTGCTDLSGAISVTTGSAGVTATGTLITVTFGAAYGAAPNVILTPANAATAALNGTTQVFPGSSTTTFFIITGSAALANSTTYKWYYAIVQ